MCQYDTQAAIPAMATVARTRTNARSGLCIGMREGRSTVSSKANGGQAEMVWLIGFGRACRTLAATDAATPRMSAARTAQRIRLSWGSNTGGLLGRVGCSAVRDPGQAMAPPRGPSLAHRMTPV